MAANKGKPKGVKLGTSASNLLASMPWLKNKAFLIPALASVLVVSMVGVVLALQATNSPAADQDSAEVSLGDSDVEAVIEPVIGPECVEGEPVCEEVKQILLEIKNWEDGVFPWTYEELVESMMYQHDVTREFAVAVINAVEFDWGEDVSASGGSESGNANSSPNGVACVSGQTICEAAKYVLIESGQGKSFTRENFIEIWMSTYGATRAKVEAIIQEIGFTNWAGGVTAQGSVSAPTVPDTATPAPATSAAPGSTPADTARSYMESWSSSSYATSRLVSIDDLVRLFSLSREDATAGLDSLNVDWSLNAAKAARYFEAQSFTDDMSRNGWISLLVDRYLFTQAEAEYAVDSLDVDWEVNASKAALWLLEYFPCDYFNDDVGDLVGYIMGTFDFTEDEAWSGMWSQFEMEGDWTWKIYPNCVP